MTIEGIPNQLYSQGMKAYQQWDEVNKFFAFNSKQDKEINLITKKLFLTETTLEKYLTTNYSLWLDLRSTDDNSLHGTERRSQPCWKSQQSQLRSLCSLNNLLL
jgi:hypothetical protein